MVVTTMPNKKKKDSKESRRNPVIPEMVAIGRRLRAAREAAQFSQADLAEKVGTSSQDLGQVENGWRSASVPRLAKLAKVLKVSQEWLLSGMDPKVYDGLVAAVEGLNRAVHKLRGRTPERKNKAG
jgi:transcriptional regulator with XRE-family HTH domain